MTRAVEFTEARDSDRVFVMRSWLASFRTSHTAGLIAMSDWTATMGPQIAKMLSHPNVRVSVAYAPATPELVLAWGAVRHDPGELPLVLYCYTKHAYRRMGLARRVLRHAGVDITEAFEYAGKTPVVSRLAGSIPRARFAPLRARH